MVADKAYRAVFLRVHPTGKMVLSLTTESDGREAEYAALVAAELGVPAARRQGRPRGHRPVRRRARVQHEPVRGYAGGGRARAAGRIRDKARLLAGAALRGRPGHADAGPTADGPPATAATRHQVKTIEDIALYAHGTGALPPGVEGGLDAQAVYRD